MVKDNIDNYHFGELEINDLTVSHLHDKNGENWFDDNAGASLLGITPRAFRKLVKSVEDNCESFGTASTKTLRVAKTGRPRRFSNFGMIVMTASRSESDKAMGIVVLAGKLLNKKYRGVFHERVSLNRK